MRKTVTQIFWDKINRVGGCWEWTGWTDKDGYGFVSDRDDNDKSIKTRAHRYSFKLHNGSIDRSLMVLHKCNNPRCVNPEHLYQGNAIDNGKDMADNGTQKGTKNPHSKLTPVDILDIRERKRNGHTLDLIADRYGISVPTVSNICTGKTWRHVP